MPYMDNTAHEQDSQQDSLSDREHIALFLPNLDGGGAEKVMLILATALVQRGYRVDLVLSQLSGPYLDHVPTGVHVVGLKARSECLGRFQALVADYTALGSLLLPVLLAYKTHRIIRYLPDFVRYLRRAQPTIVLAALTPANLVTIWAQRLADIPVRVIISEHNTLSQMIAEKASFWRWRFLPPLLKQVFARADAIIAVSNGAADDLARSTGLPRERVTTIYNPVVTPQLFDQARAPLNHPWFAAGAAPVLLGVGRLAKQKDFELLLRAFSRVLKTRAARLMILGEGPERKRLESLAQQLGIAAKVALPGFVDNPFAYMARAKGFVLSSRYEGFGNVLVEALACGCPVVSTDCPSGPAEIMGHVGHGQTGQKSGWNDFSSGILVPAGDEVALADAMLAVLAAPCDSVDTAARERRQSRAAQFSVEHAVDRYLEVLLNA